MDGSVLACTEGLEAAANASHDGCKGHEVRHEGAPIRCIDRTLKGCNHCGVH
jgi:hypothetical protein